ncbi:MAG: M23 family metallopeptidase [Bacteroidaceae bacterium]|nr:M23 family metallopeptidase [Bacteroidaceae bacterium]
MTRQRLYTCLLALIHLLPGMAQEPQFGAPFDFPLYLSGNFGELRSNHFHGGLDFKTQQVSGKPLLAIADGYISKVTVTAGGYGNALYITHDNGYTSVHGHLDRFLPEIAALVREKQYREQSFVVTLEFGPEEFRVRQGDIVAYAGNTGYSFGPHLHMEIRETATNEPIDPLPFYKDKIADTTPPRATHIMVYGAKDEGKVATAAGSKEANEVDGKIIFNSQFSIFNSLTAWGRIGTAISANDYMDGTTNNYGVRYVRLYVDGKLVSHSDVDRFSFSEDLLINSWTDYAEYRRTKRWYMRSTIAENNELRMLHADAHRGWVTIDEERDYHFRYELEDLHGNLTAYRFVVRGKRMPIVTRLRNYRYHMDASGDSRFYAAGTELWMPKGTLFEDADLQYEVYPSDTDHADIHQLTAQPIPLRQSAELTLPVRLDKAFDGKKLYVARVDGDRRIYCGGTYRYGRITTRIKELGTYTVCADTIAPKIAPIGETTWKTRGIVTLRITDAETGIRSYEGKIDGRWVLFKYSSKNARLTCDLRAEGIGPGHHTIKVEVTDMRGNKRVVSYNGTF